MVFQKTETRFRKSIYDNVAYGPHIPWPWLAAARQLDDIVCSSLTAAARVLWDEVKDRLSSPGTGLSGGQQQRLCIARSHPPCSPK